VDLLDVGERARDLATVDGTPNGALSGEIDGLPCYREHKVTRVEQWLAQRGAPPIGGFERSWFYSDSAGDLPLLRAVSDAVAVRPDPRLRAIALGAGWDVVDAV